MGFLPPEHPHKKEVHELIRQLQKQKGNAVEPEERCAHLEQILTRLHNKLEDLTEKHEALEQEQEALTKKITASQVEIDEIRQQIADAKEDKREAEERRTRTLEAKLPHTNQGQAASDPFTTLQGLP